MKRLFYITLSLVAGFALLFTSCKNIDFGDMNQPEYAATKADAANLLAGAGVSYGAIAGRLYSTNYAFYIQWMTQGIYDDEQRYANFQGAWAAYYTGPLANIQEVLNKLEELKDNPDPEFIPINGDPVNVHANALILKAIVFKRITDIFGAIPMSNALDPNNITPAYDTQQEVYNQLIDMLKTARDEMDDTKAPSKGDIFYNGNVAQLKKLANSLLMEVALQLSKVDPTTAKNVFLDAYNNPAGYITSVSDEAWYNFNNVPGMQNPWSRLRYADYYTSMQFWASVIGYDTTDVYGNPGKVTSNHTFDARAYVYMEDPTTPGEDYMELSDGSNYAQPWSEMFSNPALPMPEMTAAYTWLNIAEAAALGWVTDITPEEALQNAILASYASYDYFWGVCEKRGIDPNAWSAAAASYAAARVADMSNATVAPGGALQVIGEEKWLALYPIPWKAWSEWRRTGWPHIYALPADVTYNGGKIPTRYRYPSEEPNLNEANYKAAISDLHDPQEDQNYAHVWWDVD